MISVLNWLKAPLLRLKASLLWLAILWYRHRALKLGEAILKATGGLDEIPSSVALQMRKYMRLRGWLQVNDPSFPKPLNDPPLQGEASLTSE